ncbi:MAG TPA: 30S ribosomal protein S6, partial [Bacteroidota bacterium]|nr:30S ribosomal protein S6 [Bacteroidota bacterium]
MTNSKRLYETTFIINASIEDSQIEALNAHVQEIITGNGGEIRAVNRWGRKRLAYPIQKKNNGYYVNVEFSDIGT